MKIEFIYNKGILIIGELSEANVAEFDEAFRDLPIASTGIIVLDMSAFEVTDGVGVAAAINAIRRLLERTEKITLIAAPQLLAHNLYRVGMLADGRTELVATREEEPYG